MALLQCHWFAPEMEEYLPKMEGFDWFAPKMEDCHWLAPEMEDNHCLEEHFHQSGMFLRPREKSQMLKGWSESTRKNEQFRNHIKRAIKTSFPALQVIKKRLTNRWLLIV